MEVTNIDLSSLVIGEGRYQDDTLNLAGADELKFGTILARDSVSGKLRLYVKGGSTNENGIPKCVLVQDVSASGAGDRLVRVLIGGDVERALLVIDADGDASNVDSVVADQLRSYGIRAHKITDNSTLDNQSA
jgi:hypothetical protein